jgi:hypothetical protein
MYKAQFAVELGAKAGHSANFGRLSLRPFLQFRPKLAESPLKQPGDGGGRAAQMLGNLGQRPALPVLQDERFALCLREPV